MVLHIEVKRFKLAKLVPVLCFVTPVKVGNLQIAILSVSAFFRDPVNKFVRETCHDSSSKAEGLLHREWHSCI